MTNHSQLVEDRFSNLDVGKAWVDVHFQYARFDLCSNEKSWMMHVQIRDGETHVGQSFSVDDDEGPCDIWLAVELASLDLAKYLYDSARDKKLAFLDFLIENEVALVRNSAAKQVERLDKQIEGLREKRRRAEYQTRYDAEDCDLTACLSPDAETKLAEFREAQKEATNA